MRGTIFSQLRWSIGFISELDSESDHPNKSIGKHAAWWPKQEKNSTIRNLHHKQTDSSVSYNLIGQCSLAQATGWSTLFLRPWRPSPSMNNSHWCTVHYHNYDIHLSTPRTHSNTHTEQQTRPIPAGRQKDRCTDRQTDKATININGYKKKQRCAHTNCTGIIDDMKTDWLDCQPLSNLWAVITVIRISTLMVAPPRSIFIKLCSPNNGRQ